eukprot:1159502-Pelagomonas_calceolata.AAC.3
MHLNYKEKGRLAVDCVSVVHWQKKEVLVKPDTGVLEAKNPRCKAAVELGSKEFRSKVIHESAVLESLRASCERRLPYLACEHDAEPSAFAMPQ